MANDKQYSIGIDIGGTKILVAVLDGRYEIVAEVKNKTKPEKGDRYFLAAINDAISQVLHEAHVKREKVAGIGAGCPGFIDPKTGIVADSPNIPFLKNFPLAKRLSQANGLPVVLGNDVQTGLYGEQQLGAARGYQDVIGIFMGTGIGGALILNGELYRGSAGSAGEIGHIFMDPFGPVCGCGRRGCLEALAGRLAISSEAAIAVARQRAPSLAQKTGTDLRSIKSGALARAIVAGDTAITELIRHKAQIVGLAMANLVNIINPEMIVLGGGVVEAMPNLIVREAERVMHERALPALVRHVKVAAAKLRDHSIVMGAAKRALDRFGEKRKGDERRG